MMRELSGSIFYRKIMLLAVIRRAYNVRTMQVVGPSWLSTEKYDIEAKLPPDTPDERFQRMLQTLLAERFGLMVHHETRRLNGYLLVVAKKGLMMRRSESGRLGYRPSRDSSGNHLRGKITLPILADYLSDVVGGPVADQTGRDGLYDIELNYSSDQTPSADPSTTPGIFTALEEELGLKLQARKALFQMIIVDHVKKIPAGN